MNFDILPWVFLTLIVLVSGFIGYAADIVGRKLGKKRLTLGRLRPKHTAALGTVLLGIGVSMFTIILLFFLDQGVKQWILEGRLAVDHLTTARAELKKVEGQRDSAEMHSKDLDRRIGEKTRLLETIQKQVADLQGTINKQKTAISQQQAQVAGLNAKLATYTLRIAQVQRQLAKSKKDLTDSKARLEVVRASLEAITATRNEQTKQLKEISAQNLQFIDDNIKLERKNADLEKQRADIEQKRDLAQSELDKAESKLMASQVSLTTTQVELKRVNGELNAAYAAYAQLDEATTFLGSSFKSSRYQGLTFRYHEEVARIQVPALLGKADAESYVKILLREARALATQRGAKERVGNGFTYPAAGIMSRRDPATAAIVTPAEIEADLARQITGSPTEKVMIAASSLNSFVGEPVSLEIGIAPDPTIYPMNTVVAEINVDGSKPDEEIVAQITQLAEVRLPQKARADHMLMSTKPTTLNDYLPPGRLVALVRAIAATGRSIRLQAVTLNETRAADPLKVEFRLR